VKGRLTTIPPLKYNVAQAIRKQLEES